MIKISEALTKQHNIGIWWGALRNTVSNATMYLSLFNTAMIVPMAYVTWVQPWTARMGWDVSFALFLVIIAVLAVIVLLVEYKLFTPSNFAFWAEQFWKHGDNPISKKLEVQDERLDRIEKMLMEIIKSEKGN
jgi:hypothetical protein